MVAKWRRALATAEDLMSTHECSDLSGQGLWESFPDEIRLEGPIIAHTRMDSVCRLADASVLPLLLTKGNWLNTIDKNESLIKHITK